MGARFRWEPLLACHSEERSDEESGCRSSREEPISFAALGMTIGKASELVAVHDSATSYGRSRTPMSSSASAANSMSSPDERPLTATAPATTPSFQMGMPPPQPTNLGSP